MITSFRGTAVPLDYGDVQLDELHIDILGGIRAEEQDVLDCFSGRQRGRHPEMVESAAGSGRQMTAVGWFQRCVDRPAAMEAHDARQLPIVR